MVGKIIQFILDLFRYHKAKIGTVLAATLVFAVALFPYSDLGDLVTAKVAALTANQVYLKFDDMGLNLIPQPGFELRKVVVETPFLPALAAEELAISPSIWGLLSFRPGVSARAKGMFGGAVSLSTHGGSLTEGGSRRQVVSLASSHTDLTQLAKFALLPLALKGQLSVDSDLTLDPGFGEQPTGELHLEINKFQLPAGSVATPLGPLSLPELSLGKIELSGKLSEGRFNIESAKFGAAKEDLAGTLKGNLVVRVDKRGLQPAFSTGPYEFEIEVTVQPGFAQRASLFLGFLDAYKKPAAAGSSGNRYALKMSGVDFNNPPRMSAL